MQKAFDLIIERLEEDSFEDFEEYYVNNGGRLIDISDAIEIVNNVAEEYKGE